MKSEKGTIGFAEVQFKFLDHVAFPSLPVRKSGVSCCTCSELHLAARQGCELSVVAGLVIPTKGYFSILQRFVCDMRFKRSGYKKDTLGNNFLNFIFNSLYGRFGLGISPKKFFNTRTGGYKIQGMSVNSNPYLAAYITGFIRAVLSELAHELSIRGVAIVWFQ